VKGAAGFAIKTGTKLVKAGSEVIYLKSALTDAARDPIVATRRVIRKGQYAAEDFVDEMVLAIRKGPFRAIGISLGVGFGIGLLAGWIKGRE
jgi:hypothetical protein